MDACCGSSAPPEPQLEPRYDVPPNPTVYIVLPRTLDHPARGLRTVTAQAGDQHVPVSLSALKSDDRQVFYRLDIAYPHEGTLALGVVDTLGCTYPQDDDVPGMHEFYVTIAPWKRPAEANAITATSINDGMMTASVTQAGALYRVEWDTARSAHPEAPLPHSQLVTPYYDPLSRLLGHSSNVALGMLQLDPQRPRQAADPGIDLERVTRLRIVALLPDGTESATSIVNAAEMLIGVRAATGRPVDSNWSNRVPGSKGIAGRSSKRFTLYGGVIGLGLLAALLGTSLLRRRRQKRK
jgi:hypothetical protein